jgi:hypothetical protein
MERGIGMKRANALSTNLFILSCLLLSGLGQQMNGQPKDTRRFFPVDNNTAFIDAGGKVVISSAEPELIEEVLSSLPPDAFRKPDRKSIHIVFNEFSEGLAVAGWALCPQCRNPFWVNGFIDETGKLVIPPRNSFTRYGDFHEGLAQYWEQSWGFIDRDGRVAIKAKFYETADFSEGLARVRLTEKGKYGFINKRGQPVVPYQFEWAGDFHDGFAAVKLSKNISGFIDKTGKLILRSKQWREVTDFSEGLAIVIAEVTDDSIYRGYEETKCGFIDRTGKFAIAPRFNVLDKFSEGKAMFFQSGQNYGYGFIDKSGRVVVKPVFTAVKSFSENRAAAAIKSSNDKLIWGYIDPSGEWVIEPKFENANSFDGGLAAVNCDEYGRSCKTYIDREGKIRWQKSQL